MSEIIKAEFGKVNREELIALGKRLNWDIKIQDKDGSVWYTYTYIGDDVRGDGSPLPIECKEAFPEHYSFLMIEPSNKLGKLLEHIQVHMENFDPRDDMRSNFALFGKKTKELVEAMRNDKKLSMKWERIKSKILFFVGHRATIIIYI